MGGRSPKKVLLFCLVLVFSFSLFALTTDSKTSAVSGSQWQPGYIIDDALFFNRGAMSAQDIQTFLSAKVPVCDTWHAGSGSNQPPFTCLKDYVQYVTPTSPDAYCSNGISEGNKSAAMIIAEVGWACGINPQVLIVLLQKEQSLVTDTWPWARQYQFATGFCVFDTGPPPPSCEGTDGFFRQVYYAARQFQRYVKQPQNYNYRAGQTSNILWNVVTTGCGGANVYIQNGATAALYNYTPYQPNQAALNNLYGTGDGCSAYGNRNFWRMFNDWFGPTLGSLVKANGDNTVYLLNDTVAHPIYDVNVLNDFSALGPVRVTTASEINTHSSGPALGRMVGHSGGTLYLVNANIKLPFTSCDSVADYGFSCSNVTYLSDLLLNKLHNGPAVTSLLKANNNGTVYYVIGGTKRPIPSLDELSAFLTQVPYLNSLSSSIGDSIPTGVLANGPGKLVKTANSNTVYLVKDINNLFPIGNMVYPQEFGIGTGVRTIASAYTVLGALENKIQCSGGNYIGTSGAARLVPSNMMTHYGYIQQQFVSGGQFCSNVPTSPQSLDRFIRVSNGTIYYMSSGQKQPFAGLGVYQTYGGTGNNTTLVSDFFADTFPTGATIHN